MRGVIRDDLIVAISSENGVPIPHSRIEYLRYDPVAKAVIDIRQLPQPYTFYIDPNGVKHIVQIEPDWQPLDCNWDDELVFENGKWRIKTKEEKFQEYKQTQIAKLNRKAKDYIAQILKELDWGVSYEEALSELQNSALDAETRILFFLKPKIAGITLTQIREKVALYLASQYTTENLQKELSEKGFTQEEIERFLPLFAEAAEVASLIYWTEEVWKKEEELEETIQKTESIEEIDRLMSSIQFPPPPGGSEE